MSGMVCVSHLFTHTIHSFEMIASKYVFTGEKLSHETFRRGQINKIFNIVADSK